MPSGRSSIRSKPRRVAPEASEMAEVVVRSRVARSLKRSSNLADRKQRCHEQSVNQRPHNGDERDA